MVGLAIPHDLRRSAHADLRRGLEQSERPESLESKP